jgi:hypothetical protein
MFVPPTPHMEQLGLHGMDFFKGNVTLADFIKICRENLGIVENGQKYRPLCIKN